MGENEVIRQSNDGTGTEFSHWLRQQENCLPSKNATDCFTFHNLDYIEYCYKGKNKGKWMLIEEKRYSSDIRYSQEQIFKQLESVYFVDRNFLGCHLIQFENTNPEDGKIYIDYEENTLDELIKFLRFEYPKKRYPSFFPET
ncbi:MAG TPA: hypothetical protein VMY59_06190, partial [Candidatus Thermoplasmatota archaeon]|nr:hypothetical protein [Candidatus Thermoplasmatota archaeon]